MTQLKKILSLALISCLLLSTASCAGINIPKEVNEEAPGNDVAILFTNDMHCAIDENIGASGIESIKKTLETSGKSVFLADCGDALHGSSIGIFSKGESIIDVMNELGYSVAVPGNHDFGYGVDQFLVLAERANFPYICVNFTDAEGNLILSPYQMMESDGAKFAFVGVCTPTTPITSNPVFFHDENGNLLYGFCQSEKGEKLHEAVQSAVDEARKEGADYVILLSHLGTNDSDSPYTSYELIANTTGIDAVLDGHSHSVIECEARENKEGKTVLLSSTGTKNINVGCLLIKDDGSLEISLINNQNMESYVEDISAGFEEKMSEVLAHSDFDLTIEDPSDKHRIVRSRETNLGDLVADAFRYAAGADIGFGIGGGIRTSFPAGDITYGQILSLVPFENNVCMVEASGQEILDALELSAASLPNEFGGFLQISGMTYTIDPGIPSPVSVDETGILVSIEGARRIQNVMVGESPIDPDKTYTVAGLDYTLKNMGDGFNMFADNKLLMDNFMVDSQAIIHFLTEGLGGIVPEEYQSPYGQGRIQIIGG